MCNAEITGDNRNGSTGCTVNVEKYTVLKLEQGPVEAEVKGQQRAREGDGRLGAASNRQIVFINM